MDSPGLWRPKSSLLVLILIGLCYVRFSEGWTAAEETTLRGNLETGYETDVRPQEVTEVFMAFQMTNVEDLSIKAQTFSISGWWVLEWNDPRLAWDTSSNGNIDVLQFYEDDLWTPAIVISNSVSDLTAIDEDTIPMRVTYEGSVSWHPPGIFTVGCEMDTTYFPFDIQECHISVSSVGYTLKEVNVNTTRGLMMDFYHANGDWEVLDISVDRDTYFDDGNEYARITFYTKVKRLNTYHWLNIIMPVGVSGVLIVFVFLLPVDSGEKMGYALTCLLTYVVLLTLISADMPTTAEHTSILEVYLTIVLIISGFTVFCCIISIKLYQTPEDTRIPRFVIVSVRKCWPWVDWRKKEDKGHAHPTSSSGLQNDGKVHPEVETTGIGNGRQQQSRDDHRRHLTTTPGFGEKEKGFRTSVRRLSLEASGTDNEYSEDLVTGQVCSLVMDKMLFRIFVVAIPVFTIIILVVMITGNA